MSKRKYKGRHKTETDTILNKEIGKKIKEARLNYIVLDKKKLCTQTKLANALNPPKTFQQIQKYEKGVNGLSGAMVKRMGYALQIPRCKIGYLIYKYNHGFKSKTQRN